MPRLCPRPALAFALSAAVAAHPLHARGRLAGQAARPATAPNVPPGVAPNASPAPLVGAERWADSARRAIDAASTRGDRAALADVRTMLGRALVVTPGDPLLLHYLGFAQYREAMAALPAGDARGARALLAGADTLLARSGERRPLAETFALRSSVLGMLIGTGGAMAGMVLGPKAGDAMNRAAELGPRNPRVALLRGVSAFSTPTLWGGGMDKARTYLEQAIARFADDRPAPPLPAWGEADAHLWLGRVRQRAGDTAGARAAYARALALQPDNTWLTRVLIPSLDRPAPGSTR